MSAEHPWARRSSVPLKELVREPLIVPGLAYPARRAFDGHLSRMSGPFGRQSVQEMDLPRAAQALAARGQGVAIVADEPQYGLHPMVITGPAPDERVDLPLFALWSATHYAVELIGQCVAEVRDFCVRTFPDVAPA